MAATGGGGSSCSRSAWISAFISARSSFCTACWAPMNAEISAKSMLEGAAATAAAACCCFGWCAPGSSDAGADLLSDADTVAAAAAAAAAPLAAPSSTRSLPRGPISRANASICLSNAVASAMAESKKPIQRRVPNISPSHPLALYPSSIIIGIISTLDWWAVGNEQRSVSAVSYC